MSFGGGAEDMEQGGLLSRASDLAQGLKHPVAAGFHVLFKTLAILIYLFGGWFSSNFVNIFVWCVLMLAFDFWTVKNVSGRLMVGLRWCVRAHKHRLPLLRTPRVRAFWGRIAVIALVASDSSATAPPSLPRASAAIPVSKLGVNPSTSAPPHRPRHPNPPVAGGARSAMTARLSGSTRAGRRGSTPLRWTSPSFGSGSSRRPLSGSCLA